MQRMIEAVKLHAMENDNKAGWAYIVEYWAQREYVAAMSGATTISQAIANVTEIVEILQRETTGHGD